ncbi:MAG: CRISPR-associated protein Cas4 [Chloroflexi bacterium]|nr:CRISPR-associated protein Cas4 [Chloroflexota bacterium]
MEKGIGGTLIWYYTICPRQVWLLAHNVLPDQADHNIQVGRLIDQWSYPQQRHRGINLDNTVVIDVITGEGVVAEVKKSSASLDAARLQLAYYLYYLKHNKGVTTKGVLLVPEERRRYPLELTPEVESQLEEVLREVESLRSQDKPVPARRIHYCKKCAYAGVCWG